MAPQKFLQTIRLDEVTRRALQARLLDVPSPYENFKEFTLHQQQIFPTILPLDVQRALLRFRTELEAPGVISIPTGVVDPVLPPTPRDGGRAWGKTTFVSEALAVGFGLSCGLPYAYYTEKNAEFIHNIVAVLGSEYTKSNESSKLDFALHQDNIGVTPTPTVFVLSCVRGDPQGTAETYIVDARALMASLDAATVSALRDPVFEVRTPESFAGDKRWLGPRPALSGPPEAPELCLNLLRTVRGTTPAVKRALEAVARVVEEQPHLIESVLLTAGDVLLVHNRRVLHGRRPFVADYTREENRWLQRVYVHADLWPYRHPDASSWLY